MNIYAVVKDEKVIEYLSLNLLKKVHGEDAQYQVFTREQLKAAGQRVKGSAYLHARGNEAILRDSEEHDRVIAALEEINSIDAGLARIDKAFGHRAGRGLMRKMAEAEGIAGDDGDLMRLGEAEARAGELRARRAALREEIGLG